jgi:hypothetical protein
MAVIVFCGIIFTHNKYAYLAGAFETSEKKAGFN